MRSRSPLLLLKKELRELIAARAYWLLLLALGPLVGHAFLTAVSSYSEVSGGAGGPAALSQGLSPLDGFVVPLFGAYAIAATLLLPFVAIRMLAAEKENGGLALVLQSGVRPLSLLLAKLAVLVVGWMIAMIPAFVALLLWRAHGGHLDAGEVGAVVLGHLLRALVTAAVGLAAAALTESASTAAIVALGVTLATWALDFMAAVRGGLVQRLAEFTPEAALRVFEHGELSAAVIIATLVVTAALVALAAVTLPFARRRREVLARVLASVALAAACTVAVASMRMSRDVSEDRRNSFARADERALADIRGRLDVEVHLAAEDPRLADLERGVLRKLRRVMPEVHTRYVAGGSTGLFEASDARYGEIWYSLGGRRVMSRSTTPPIVLETLYELAGRRPPTPENEPAYSGYPLVMRAGASWLLFFVAWPALVLLAWWLLRRAPSRSTFSL